MICGLPLLPSFEMDPNEIVDKMNKPSNLLKAEKAIFSYELKKKKKCENGGIDDDLNTGKLCHLDVVIFGETSSKPVRHTNILF